MLEILNSPTAEFPCLTIYSLQSLSLSDCRTNNLELHARDIKLSVLVCKRLSLVASW